jgi:hypothetical protein
MDFAHQGGANFLIEFSVGCMRSSARMSRMAAKAGAVLDVEMIRAAT